MGIKEVIWNVGKTVFYDLSEDDCRHLVIEVNEEIKEAKIQKVGFDKAELVDIKYLSFCQL